MKDRNRDRPDHWSTSRLGRTWTLVHKL